MATPTIRPTAARFSLCLAATLLATALAGAADDKEGGQPLDLGSDPVLSGTIRFLDPGAEAAYKEGLEALRFRVFDKAHEQFQKGRKRVKEASEIEIFERLLKEAQAGRNLDRLRKASQSDKTPVLHRALKDLERARPEFAGLLLEKEHELLTATLRRELILAIDDFEEPGAGAPPAKESAPAGAAGDDEGTGGGEAKGTDGGKPKGGEKGKAGGPDPGGAGGPPGGAPDPGRRGPFGGLGGFSPKDLARLFGGGERQAASEDPTKVRQGKHSWRWKVGGNELLDTKILAYEIDGGAAARYEAVCFSIRGSANVTTQVSVLLTHEPIDLRRYAMRPGDLRGYETQVPVRGGAWKDLRLGIAKDFKAKDEPDRKKVAHLYFIVRGQPEQVLYLDAIQLER